MIKTIKTMVSLVTLVTSVIIAVGELKKAIEALRRKKAIEDAGS